MPIDKDRFFRLTVCCLYAALERESEAAPISLIRLPLRGSRARWRQADHFESATYINSDAIEWVEGTWGRAQCVGRRAWPYWRPLRGAHIRTLGPRSC